MFYPLTNAYVINFTWVTLDYKLAKAFVEAVNNWTLDYLKPIQMTICTHGAKDFGRFLSLEEYLTGEIWNLTYPLVEYHYKK